MGRHFRLLAPQSGDTWLFTDVDDLDITDREAVRAYVREHDVKLIVNCAAYTNVDRAESDEATARRINGDAVGYMAEAMREVDGTLIHFSTDYVFGGTLLLDLTKGLGRWRPDLPYRQRHIPQRPHSI